MTKQRMKPVAMVAMGTVFLVSTGAFAIAQSSNSPEIKAEKIEYSGKHYGKRHGKRRGERRGGAVRHILRNADVNKDGSVTQAELDAYRAAQVANADANNDGNISLAEFQTIWLAQTKLRMVRAFQHLDTDADGTITKAEQDAPFANLIKRMDRNNDGELNADDRRRHGRDRRHKRHGND